MDRSQYAPAFVVRMLCVSLHALLVAPVVAQTIGDWRTVPSVTTPPSRTGFALAETPNGDLLLLGGDAANPNANEWLWDGVDWRPYTSFVGPRRDNPAMGNFGPFGMLVYGGTSGGTFLTDTWRSADGLHWSVASSPLQPGILTNTSLAYDPQTECMVMVGQTLQGLYATWCYSLQAGWIAGPTFPAASATVVTDSVRGEVLLFEGGFPLVAVSRLRDFTWQQLGVSQQGLSIGEMAFDERRARAVLLQPFDSRDTAEWNGIHFEAKTSPTGQFVSPLASAMSYHRARQETVLVINYGNGIQTYRHAADAAPGSVAFGQPCGLSPILQLANGSLPRPGASHRLEAFHAGVGVTLSVIGFSHTVAGGLPLPQVIPVGGLGCELLVDPTVVTSLGLSPQASQLISLPNSAALLGERYSAQFVVFAASGIVGASNALDLQIGQPLPEYELTETFVDASNRDPVASGDVWQFGSALPSRIGGDGRHGTFSLDLGTEVAPGVFEISTESTVIPAGNTFDGEQAVVTDGRFYFTDFTVPAGVTVRFVGSVAAQVFVRGQANVLGAVSVDAPDMPAMVATFGLATGQRVTAFDGRLSATGQVGGAGGPGGGQGGNGGNRCLDTGPIIVAGVDVTSGQNGSDLRVPVGHAYANGTVDTGGRGSLLMPPSGVWSWPVPALQSVYCAYFSPGGAGGGFATSGGAAATPLYVGGGTGVVAAGAIAAPGVGFPFLPFPSSPLPGYSSLDHFAIGGSGGGGGGSHGYGLIALGSPSLRWLSGHGGSGGGGSLVIRSGSDLQLPGELSSRGGNGALIAGTSSSGISSPGGGGSGGSILLQSASHVTFGGVIDTSGGQGGRVGMIDNVLLRMEGQAGEGSDGNFRIEAPQMTIAGSTTPPFNSALHRAALLDADLRSGSRSKWLLPASVGLPNYLRYELLVDVGGLPVLFSDDPAVSPLAANLPSGIVMLRFQGAQIDPLTGKVLPGTEGPWRPVLSGGPGSLNSDHAQAVRFDMVINKASGPVSVLELRIKWR
jgi:hypothetical protein